MRRENSSPCCLIIQKACWFCRIAELISTMTGPNQANLFSSFDHISSTLQVNPPLSLLTLRTVRSRNVLVFLLYMQIHPSWAF